MKIRIRFCKDGAMKFIGHLDMMRYFQKVLRRADVDVAYSQGFSPHQLMSFASPLSVGLTSRGEYMDIFVNSCEDSQTMVDRINAKMVEGSWITSFKQILDETKHSNAMSLIAAADYTAAFREGMFPQMLTKDLVKDFMARDQIIVTKKTKKSVAETDIRPMIHALELTDDQYLKMRLASGSAANLKPELVISTLVASNASDDAAFDPYALLICRDDMFALASDGDGFISLDDLGVMIDAPLPKDQVDNTHQTTKTGQTV